MLKPFISAATNFIFLLDWPFVTTTTLSTSFHGLFWGHNNVPAESEFL